MTIIRPAITHPIGVTSHNEAVPAMSSVRRISSVAYATDESASDERIASPVAFVNRSRCARWDGIGLPTSNFLKAPTAKPGDTIPSSGLRGELTGSGLDCPTGARAPDAPLRRFPASVGSPDPPLGRTRPGEVLAMLPGDCQCGCE